MKLDAKVVEAHLREMLNDQCHCRLSADIMTEEDRAAGLKEGQLCDNCENEIVWRLEQMSRGVLE